MTKKEIYEQVVYLTSELAKTNVAKIVFEAAEKRDSEKIDSILNSFPDFFPELYQKIIDFGTKFKELIGESDDDKMKLEDWFRDCSVYMYSLLDLKIIEKIDNALKLEDATAVRKVIDEFKQENSGFAESLVQFQKAYDKFREENKSSQGAIFGYETDVENGIYEFDTNIIDVLSFYILIIFTDVPDFHFFYEELIEEEGELIDIPTDEKYIYALEKATNATFARFANSYNIVDFVGKDKDFLSFGKLFVNIFENKFD